MDDYKPNSHVSKTEAKEPVEERKKLEKVITGTATTKKKSEMRKLAGNIISEDAKNVKSYVFGEVLLPAFKKAIFDIVTEGIDMVLYGGKGGGRRNTPSGSRISYGGFYNRDNNGRRYDDAPRAQTRFDFDDIIFDNRGDAETVLDQMREAIDRYKIVTVADMYDLAQLTAPYTAERYGWTSLINAGVIRARGGGYCLDLPKAKPIER